MAYKHGKSNTPTYQSWVAMKKRCSYAKHPAYKHYGGRGITVCDKWQSFAGFYEDMGERPEGTDLDRLDNDSGYYKANCRWATPAEQACNRRNTVVIEFNGRRLMVHEWAAELGIKPSTLWTRLYKGMPVERVLTQPVSTKNLFRSVYIEHRGQRRTKTEWAELTGIHKNTLDYRLSRGWSVDRALTTPPADTYRKSACHPDKCEG